MAIQRSTITKTYEEEKKEEENKNTNEPLQGMNQASLGPFPPSKLVFLSQLSTEHVGSKVRFLGCVSKYDSLVGHLILDHNYTVQNDTHRASSRTRSSKSRSRRRRRPPRVAVDINALLEVLTSSHLQVGSWLEIIGYVHADPDALTDAQTGSVTKQLARDSGGSMVRDSVKSIYVQATMILPADSVRIGQFERVVRDVQEVGSWIDVG
ncbi:hypothetical protein FQN57_004317 [Myotisia sp. PD_48]|nr:hypothetical protein FQN57_004317 [Myotisia sp. PD_48]